MNTEKTTVAVLFGGQSSEYEVSLSSASGVLDNIDTEKFTVLTVGITREGRFFLYTGDRKNIADDTWHKDAEHLLPLAADPGNKRFTAVKDGRTIAVTPAAVLPMVHGKHCEDGTLQGLFELVGVPFVGCDCTSSAVCMDKAFTKAVVKTETDIRQAESVTLRAADVNDETIERIREKCEKKLGYPMFVKPARAGSSVGVSKVYDSGSFAGAVTKALREDSKILVEEAIKGREIEVAVLEENGKYTVAHAAEIDKGGADFYDYETKYISDVSSYYLPARITDEEMKTVRENALTIFKTLDCRGLSRVDFFITDGGELVFNEINTLPGFTPISMYPKMMINEGISYKEVITRLIESALR